MTTIKTINNTTGTTTAIIIIIPLESLSSSSLVSSFEELEGAEDVDGFAVVIFRPLLTTDIVVLVEGVVESAASI